MQTITTIGLDIAKSVFQTGFLPEADIMLAQKIALETNEKAALKVAHQSSPLSLFPAERMRLHLELRTRR